MIPGVIDCVVDVVIDVRSHGYAYGEADLTPALTDTSRFHALVMQVVWTHSDTPIGDGSTLSIILKPIELE